MSYQGMWPVKSFPWFFVLWTSCPNQNLSASSLYIFAEIASPTYSPGHPRPAILQQAKHFLQYGAKKWPKFQGFSHHSFHIGRTASGAGTFIAIYVKCNTFLVWGVFSLTWWIYDCGTLNKCHKSRRSLAVICLFVVVIKMCLCLHWSFWWSGQVTSSLWSNVSRATSPSDSEAQSALWKFFFFKS